MEHYGMLIGAWLACIVLTILLFSPNMAYFIHKDHFAWKNKLMPPELKKEEFEIKTIEMKCDDPMIPDIVLKANFFREAAKEIERIGALEIKDFAQGTREEIHFALRILVRKTNEVRHTCDCGRELIVYLNTYGQGRTGKATCKCGAELTIN